MPDALMQAERGLDTDTAGPVVILDIGSERTSVRQENADDES